MAGEDWNVAMVVGVQSALGSVNTTIRDQGTSPTTALGLILGDRESGDGNSGITLPQLVRDDRKRADVSGTTTPTASTFQRERSEGLAVNFELKGNGATSGTPSVGEAAPDEGVDALLQMAKLVGANGDIGAEYDFTPATAQVYGTVKLWVGDLAYVFQDCIVDTLSLPFVGGEVVVASAGIRVGSVLSTTSGIGALTLDYTTQATLSAPTVESSVFSYGVSRDFQSLTVDVQNSVTEIPSGNSASGVRLAVEEQRVNFELLTEQDSGDTDYDDTQIVIETAPTDDATWRLGSLAGAAATMNGLKFEVNNIQQMTNKAERAADKVANRVTGYATSTTAGGEFVLTFD